MRICILCDDQHLDAVRSTAKEIFNFKVMNIPVSASGAYPATHWLCFMYVTDAVYGKIQEVMHHTIIEKSGPKEFLIKWNLQIIS